MAGTDQLNIIDQSENIKAFEIENIKVGDLKPSKLDND
jgi:hypothetical protein|tara:strand:- start:349 stop:462 length:114 start_codon:yes stop_codon:yes gene_type:complete